jgi:hypothetical protein
MFGLDHPAKRISLVLFLGFVVWLFLATSKTCCNPWVSDLPFVFGAWFFVTLGLWWDKTYQPLLRLFGRVARWITSGRF